ncbi:MAG TPA: amino acid racemase [Bacteroidales bacterium]|nr:amino acid racemase [Bacteroidales bacterium]
MNMIGIIGGVGPFAGLDLASKIFSQTVAQRDQDHLPLAMLSVPSRIDDRTEYLLGQTPNNPAHVVSDLIIRLEQLGATVVGIPCNTMHAPAIFDVLKENLLRQKSAVRVLHMVEEVIVFIQKNHPTIRKVGVLSTTGTWKTGLYYKGLQAKGYSPVALGEVMQQEVHDAIYNEQYGIKARSNPVTARAKEVLMKGLRQLRDKGAEGIILGCTEVPYALTGDMMEGVRLFDANLILARSLIGHSYPDKLRPLV